MQRKVDKEAQFLQTLSHPNVLRFYGRIEGSSKLVTEYLEKNIFVEGKQIAVNNLRQLLDELEDSLGWSVRLQIALESAKGLNYLHDAECFHCDFKAANIFLGSDENNEWIVKIGDFGEARAECKEYMVTQLSSQDPSAIAGGTIPYIAPEVLRGDRAAKASDIYSFAMLLIELLCPSRSNPWSSDCKSFCILQNVSNSKRPSLPDHSTEFPRSVWERLVNLVRRCWNDDPAQRPNCKDIVSELKSVLNLTEHEGTENVDKADETTASSEDIPSRACKDLFTDDTKFDIVKLSLHQGSAMETFGDIAASFVEAGTDLPSELFLDMQEQTKTNDGTNACAFFPIAIANWLQSTDFKNETQKAKLAVEQIMLEVPKKINSIRDMSCYFSVEEAADLLKIANLYNLQTEPVMNSFSGVKTADGEKALLEALTILHNKRPVSAVFTCPPLSFCIGCVLSGEDSSSFIVIDTHSVPERVGGDGNGIMLEVKYPTRNHTTAAEKLTTWIKDRLLSSNKGDSLLSLTIVKASTEKEMSEKGPKHVENLTNLTDIDDIEMEDQVTEVSKVTGVFEDQVTATSQEDEEMPDDELLDISIKLETSLHEVSENPGKISTVDEQSDWILPDQLEEPDKNREVVWKGHLTQFGLSKFRPFQRHAIHAVELGLDSIIIQPTASGKSICFQLPALLEKGKIIVVVCPTLSLINSQIEQLQGCDIQAASVGPLSGGSCIQSVSEVDKSSLPPILFTTPEYFDKKLKNELLEMRENVKMLVLDEVHKMFDRSSNFRSCYDALKSLKEDFKETPLMALTATLSDMQLQDLCRNYLRRPVLIKSSVNKKNTKINIEKYETVHKKAGKDMWKNVAEHIVKTIQDDYAIVYMDFKKDVDLLVENLKEAGIEDTTAYHGGLKTDVKKKIDSAFRSKKFQVLVATESYEVGTHSPHVNIVLRIGCMRNMAVIMQEFGRAGRNSDESEGILFVNEHTDDQRLIYWTRSCSFEEVENKKRDYEKAWKWIYGLKAGMCIRKCLLENFENVDVIEQASSGQCCSGCDITEERDFNVKDTALLLLNSLEELAKLPSLKDVNEEKLIAWLRGCKRDWLSAPEIQKYLDKSETYGKGKSLDTKPLNKEWWSTHLRQIAHLNFIDINFKIDKFQMI
jgi:RecQ family ATP-dependent DNA helicase